jgi:putative solute:sodium symporter small subunit
MSNSVQTSVVKTYWQRTLALIGACLMVWLLATLLPLVMAQWQVSGAVLGWPLVFALAAFGVPLVYLTIIGVYCLAMDRLDAKLLTHKAREDSQ